MVPSRLDNRVLIMSDLVVHVTGSPTLTVHMHHGDADDDEEHGSSSKQVTIDFTPPFKRVNILEEIERHTGTLPPYGTPGTSRCLVNK